SVAGEAAQYVLVSCLGSASSYSTVFSHNFDPSLRAKQMSDRFLPFSVAWVRNTFSPQTIGVELPVSGSGIFHFTFSVADHLTGRFFSVEKPCPVGPRHPGQLSARAVSANANSGTTAAGNRRGRRMAGSCEGGFGVIVGCVQEDSPCSRSRPTPRR